MRTSTPCAARGAPVAVLLSMTLLACGGDDAPQSAQPTQTATATAEPTETPTPTATATAAPTASRERSRVSRRQAIRIARKRVGGGRVVDVDRDEDDGREVWEIEIRRGRVEHDVTVAVRGGKILDHDRDRDD